MLESCTRSGVLRGSGTRTTLCSFIPWRAKMGPASLLLIDDDAFILQSLRRLLTTPSVQAHCVRTAAQAMTWLKAGGSPRVAIFDQPIGEPSVKALTQTFQT